MTVFDANELLVEATATYTSTPATAHGAPVTGPASAVFTASYFELGKQYELRYRIADESTWTTLSALSPYFEVSNLQSNTRYFYQMRVFCSDAWGEWSYGYYFTTKCDD